MLKIKLARAGKKNYATYKIIVVEARSKRNGKYLELLGTYNPNTHPHEVKINSKKYQYWLSHGAKPTDTVNRLAEKNA